MVASSNAAVINWIAGAVRTLLDRVSTIESKLQKDCSSLDCGSSSQVKTVILLFDILSADQTWNARVLDVLPDAKGAEEESRTRVSAEICPQISPQRCHLEPHLVSDFRSLPSAGWEPIYGRYSSLRERPASSLSAEVDSATFTDVTDEGNSTESGVGHEDPFSWSLDRQVAEARRHLDSLEASDPFSRWASVVQQVLEHALSSVFRQLGHDVDASDLRGRIQVFLCFEESKFRHGSFVATEDPNFGRFCEFVAGKLAENILSKSDRAYVDM
eukprot:TRINITY_DN39107_c0_g1_i1.p1 TRINITY_DN39107_c0_g1~~TRINITY_DN39107_c0_g1_i1.p1  ORF type:complete len:272 (-),score=42.00 TRINITY_DN39107_c0_g1_i1:130-945(-)